MLVHGYGVVYAQLVVDWLPVQVYSVNMLVLTTLVCARVSNGLALTKKKRNSFIV